MAALHTFKDHVGVLEELRTRYHRSDDSSKVLAVEQVCDDATRMARDREQQVLSAIRGLSLDVAAAEAAATPPEPASAHAQRAELLAAATRAAEEELAELDMQDRCARPCTATPALPGRVPLTRLTLVCWRDSTSLQKQRQCLEALRAGCQRRSERVEDLVTDAEPRTRYELSLYANITNVTWQLDRGSAYVRGTVSDMVGRDIRNIDLDPSQLTTFQLVNAVWDSLT